MEGVVVDQYSPYPMQPPAYHAPPMQYSMPPVGQYPYPQQPVTAQPPCATCQNQAAQNWQPYPQPAPAYPQQNYPPAYSQQPAHHYQPAPQNWQQPQPTYQYPQPATPQPVLPQPAQPVPPQQNPATTGLQPMPAPAAQVSYLPGYSNAVPAFRQAIR